MSILTFTPARSHAVAGVVLSPTMARGLYLLVITVAATVGVLSTDPGAAQAAATEAGADLTRLLRLMMLIKAGMAAVAVWAVFWRLAWPMPPVRFAVSALAGATMVAGPGLIWGMAHVGVGALLLHAGLAGTVVLLWRDPAVWSAMDAALKRRAARR